MREACADFETELREFNGEHDHVHLLIHYPPKATLSELVNSPKGSQPRYFARNTAHTSTHTSGSDISGLVPISQSVGGAPLTALKQDIEQ
jgi:putative transposase